VHPRRTPGGTRVYDAEDEQRFAALLSLARLGFSLETLADLAGIRPGSRTGDEASHRVGEKLQAMDAELEKRAQAIERHRADIKRAQTFLRGCHGCRQRPVRAVCDACEVSAGLGGIDVLRVVWDEPARD
jgi:DNA-binding transcriptional MerR regulator